MNNTIHLVNMDRDRIYRYTPDSTLHTAPVLHNGTLIGYNLYVDGCLLGTFDDVADVVREATCIVNYSGEIYIVSGYEDYETEI